MPAVMEVSINSTSYKRSDSIDLANFEKPYAAKFPLIPLPIKEAIKSYYVHKLRHSGLFPLIPLPIKEAI